jgi:hypothetical protein
MKKFSFLHAALLCLALIFASSSHAVRYNVLDVGTLGVHGNSSGNTQSLVQDASEDTLVGSGTTVPTDGTSGYSKGAMFIDTNAVNAMRAIYENQGTTTSSKFKLIGGEEHVLAVTYDFTVDGGTHNTSYGLGVSLPDNAVITRSWYEAFSNFTSATGAAIMSLDIPTDDEQGLVAFTSISSTDSGNIWDAGYHEGIQTGTAATFAEKTTAEREITFSIASSENLLQGKATFFIEYVVTE